MKYIITLLLLLLSGLNNHLILESDYISIIENKEKEQLWNELIQKIVQVESEGNPSAIGDEGKAVGLLQIHPIVIKDVNRIVNKQLYTYEDRFDPDKSLEIFEIYQSYYNPERDIEKAAKLWNGGPQYYKYPKVEKYWEKINNVEI